MRNYHENSVDVGDDFMLYVFSLTYIESRFNSNAVSDAYAYGLMQLTRPAVDTAVVECGLPRIRNMTRMRDPATNIRYGSCYLKKLHEELGDWTRTLIAYNGGYKQLTAYDSGASIVSETANYVIQVHRVLNTVCLNGDRK